ncbi:MAG: hypothetical protein HQL67_12745 [Magnetococcales bacterium]|nr:hypothetical protein [Magnetococcales bacterium]
MNINWIVSLSIFFSLFAGTICSAEELPNSLGLFVKMSEGQFMELKEISESLKKVPDTNKNRQQLQRAIDTINSHYRDKFKLAIERGKRENITRYDFKQIKEKLINDREQAILELKGRDQKSYWRAIFPNSASIWTVRPELYWYFPKSIFSVHLCSTPDGPKRTAPKEACHYKNAKEEYAPFSADLLRQSKEINYILRDPDLPQGSLICWEAQARPVMPVDRAKHTEAQMYKIDLAPGIYLEPVWEYWIRVTTFEKNQHFYFPIKVLPESCKPGNKERYWKNKRVDQNIFKSTK